MGAVSSSSADGGRAFAGAPHYLCLSGGGWRAFACAAGAAAALDGTPPDAVSGVSGGGWFALMRAAAPGVPPEELLDAALRRASAPGAGPPGAERLPAMLRAPLRRRLEKLFGSAFCPAHASWEAFVGRVLGRGAAPKGPPPRVLVTSACLLGEAWVPGQARGEAEAAGGTADRRALPVVWSSRRGWVLGKDLRGREAGGEWRRALPRRPSARLLAASTSAALGALASRPVCDRLASLGLLAPGVTAAELGQACAGFGVATPSGAVLVDGGYVDATGVAAALAEAQARGLAAVRLTVVDCSRTARPRRAEASKGFRKLFAKAAVPDPVAEGAGFRRTKLLRGHPPAVATRVRAPGACVGVSVWRGETVAAAEWAVEAGLRVEMRGVHVASAAATCPASPASPGHRPGYLALMHLTAAAVVAATAD